MRVAICALCIERRRRVLLLRKEDFWILLGGKPDEGEFAVECLVREQGEELPLAIFEIGRWYGEFTGLTPRSNTPLTAKVYLGKVTGNLTPGAEILEARHFTREQLPDINVSEITTKILDSAINTGLLI